MICEARLGPAQDTLAFPYNSLTGELWDYAGPIDPAEWFTQIDVTIRVGTANPPPTPYVPLQTTHWQNVRYGQVKVEFQPNDDAWEPVLIELFIIGERG